MVKQRKEGKIHRNALVTTTLILIGFLWASSANYNSEIQFTKEEITKFKEVNCLAKNIYYEAGSESFEGKLGVAQVTINRLKSDQFPDTICKIVNQKINGICQFSWVCKSPRKLVKDKNWEQSLYIAQQAMSVSPEKVHMSYILYKTDALYYHNNKVRPYWKRKNIVTRIGNHIFYRNIK